MLHSERVKTACEASNRLYEEGKIKTMRKLEQQKLKDEQLKNDCTFKPAISISPTGKKTAPLYMPIKHRIKAIRSMRTTSYVPPMKANPRMV